MLAAFESLSIDRMQFANSSLREGVLYELLGRIEHHDTREATVRAFMRRYHVDRLQAKRVERFALRMLTQTSHTLEMDEDTAEHYLIWASKLHEIGISIAHSGYHKHSAYILEHADMPGFSTMEQRVLSLLVRAQRRSLGKFAMPPFEDDRSLLIMILRLAILFHRSRNDEPPPKVHLHRGKQAFQLLVPSGWLATNPLTVAVLESEVSYWKQMGIDLILTD